MRTRLLRSALVLMVLCGPALLPGTSKAEFLYFLGNPAGYESELSQRGIRDSNLVFNGPGLIRTGPLVQGRLVAAGVLDLTSDEPLTTLALGQARVTATDGDFTNLSIFPADPLSHFEAISLSVNPLTHEVGPITLTVENMTGSLSQASIDVSRGLTFFGVVATGGDLFSRAALSGNVQIQDVRQIRARDPESAIGPELSSLTLFGIGVAILGVARLLRKFARLRAT